MFDYKPANPYRSVAACAILSRQISPLPNRLVARVKGRSLCARQMTHPHIDKIPGADMVRSHIQKAFEIKFTALLEMDPEW